MKNLLLFLLLNTFAITSLCAQTINLPEPVKSGGMPLMEALSKRSSVRAYSSKELSRQQISNLLWASFGINRADGKRTAPSANNKQEIDIYVLLKEGAYVYDAVNNGLKLVVKEDLRGQATSANFAEAPLQLIFVGDNSKGGAPDVDCGYISQNAYLFCASEGLVTCARGTVNRDFLKEKLALRADQKIILGHSVGYPKE